MYQILYDTFYIDLKYDKIENITKIDILTFYWTLSLLHVDFLQEFYGHFRPHMLNAPVLYKPSDWNTKLYWSCTRNTKHLCCDVLQKAGIKYGLLPKMSRLQVIHQYLFHLCYVTYGHSIKKGSSLQDKVNQSESRYPVFNKTSCKHVKTK